MPECLRYFDIYFYTFWSNLLKSYDKIFEQDVKKQKEIKSDEGSYDDLQDNTLSLIVKKISKICIQIIQTIVLLISQFISNIL